MDTQVDPPGTSEGPGSLTADEDLSALIPLARKDQVEDDQATSDHRSPDQDVSDLLEVIESEIQADTTPAAPPEPKADPDVTETDPSLDAKTADSDSTNQSEVALAKSEEEAEQAADQDDLSSLIPGGPKKTEVDTAASAESESPPEPQQVDDTAASAPKTASVSPASPPAPEELAARTVEPVEAISAQRWHYLKAVLLLAEEGLERADEAVDSLHPRARALVGLAGIVLLTLALVLVVTQLLGWI